MVQSSTGSYTPLMPFKAFFLESGVGKKGFSGSGKERLRPPELCMGLESGVKHDIILLVPRLHMDGKCVWVEDPSG